MRFYLDENISGVVAQAARAWGLDVTSAQELNRFGLADDEQLLWAAGEGRCLVTRDSGDFPGLSIRFAASQRPHAGVAIVPPSMRSANVGTIVRAMLDLAEQYEDGLPSYGVVYLTPVRRR